MLEAVGLHRSYRGRGMVGRGGRVAAVDGVDIPQRDPREVSEAALANADDHAVEIVAAVGQDQVKVRGIGGEIRLAHQAGRRDHK